MQFMGKMGTGCSVRALRPPALKIVCRGGRNPSIAGARSSRRGRSWLTQGFGLYGEDLGVEAVFGVLLAPDACRERIAVG